MKMLEINIMTSIKKEKMNFKQDSTLFPKN